MSPTTRARRRAAQQCLRCKSPTGGFAYCPGCRELNRNYLSAMRDELVAAQLCTTCLSPTFCGHRQCNDCLRDRRDAEAADRRASWKANGIAPRGPGRPAEERSAA